MARVFSLAVVVLLLALLCCACSYRYRPRRPLCLKKLLPCKLTCPNGYRTNIYGCPTCLCKPHKPVCGPVCKIFCPNGLLTDKRGCPICKCRKCRPVQCRLACRKGRAPPRGCKCPPCKRKRDYYHHHSGR